MDLWQKLQAGKTDPLSEAKRQIFQKVRRKMVELGFENPFCPASFNQTAPESAPLELSRLAVVFFGIIQTAITQERKPMKHLKQFALRTIAAISICAAAQEAHAQILPVGPPTNSISSWGFEDTNFWTSDLNYSPLSFSNLVGTFYGDGTSLMVDSNNPAWLQFGGFNSDGTTNLSVGPSGSIFFWYSPNWASATTNSNGNGPGVFGRLLEVGTYTTNASYGWFSLFVDPKATNIYFATQTNSGDGAVYTNLSVPIDWATNVWQFVALTYSPTNLSLYTNGVMATNVSALTVYPGLDVLTNGFWIGSDSNGILQMHGWMDDLYTYNYSLDSTTVSNIYDYFFGVYTILPFGNVMADALIQSGPSTPTTVPTFNAVTGSGDLTPISTNTISCISSSQVWITNITATPSGTNMIVKFTIAGGSNGVPYDVFANSVLNFSSNTNFAWAWMGQGFQCVTYTLTIPSPTCFLILGTPQDSDSDGLTDAYEELVSKTDPNNPDSSGDGMLDGWKVLWGMSANINNVAQPSERANYSYDGTGRLETDSGIENEIFNFDPEGNIQLDQQ